VPRTAHAHLQPTLQVALLAALLFGEALTPASIGGLALGVAGLLLLELPEDMLLNAGSA